MAETEADPDVQSTSTVSPLVVCGKKYAPLAEDGRFDIIVLGTGLTNSLLSGLLATHGWKVLHMEREKQYGGPTASLNLSALYRKYAASPPTKDDLAALGKSSAYNIDLVPKAVLARGKLSKILVHSEVVRYLDFKRIGGSFIFKGAHKKLYHVPATPGEAAKTEMMGWIQKRRFQQFLAFVAKCDPAAVLAKSLKYDICSMSMGKLYDAYGLGKTERDLAGHVLALQADDTYLTRPALETVRTIRLYAASLQVFGQSPFIYPQYGLGQLAEGCCRLCTINEGIYFLNEPVDEILRDSDGMACGIRVGEKAASARCVLAEPSYVSTKMLRRTGRVARSFCILDHPIQHHDGTAAAGSGCQIVMPSQQIALAGYPCHSHDVFVSCLSHAHKVVPPGRWLAIISTVIETASPGKELEPGIELLGTILKRFDTVLETYEPVDASGRKKLHICKSYDATSNFETVANDVLHLWKCITGKDLDMAISANITAV